MANAEITNKLWGYRNDLRDYWMTYYDYVRQLTILLFLKMANERAKTLCNQKSPVPDKYSWPSLIKKDGDEPFDYSRHTLETLVNEMGLFRLIYSKSQEPTQATR